MKTKRRFLAVALVAVMVVSVLAPVAIFAAVGEIRVTLHGEDVDFCNDSPVLIDSKTYVPRWFIVKLVGDDVPLADAAMLPLRSTMENLGHIIEWISETRTANIRLVMEGIDMENGAIATATTFMDKLVAGDTMGATLMLSPEMQQAFPIDMMIFGMHGGLNNFTVLNKMEAEGMHISTVSANHTMGTAIHNVVIDASGAVAGVQTVSFAFEPRLPAESANFTAEAITVGEGTDWPLDGLLTIPNGASAENPVPAVIIVHGSGGQNMDSSLFENRPHADIAEYLSSNGIAVLRHHKRTWIHSHGVQAAEVFGDNMTVWEESIEDALLAAEILRADERISGVFVAGHSLGGILAPRIAEEGNLDGVIMLAASPNPFFVISYHANVQAIGDMLTAGEIPQEEADALLATARSWLDDSWARIHLPAEELAGTQIFHVPAIYQQSIYNSLPLPFITEGNRPTLIIHGGRDFQVFTETCFEPMVEATKGMAHVTTMYFEGVNHLLMQSQTDFNDLRDYHIAGRVDENLLRSIVDWILGQ